MWEPQPLITLWAFTACYWDSFTFYLTVNYYVVGFEVLSPINMKSSIFWDITLCSSVNIRVLLAACFSLVPCLAYSSTLKMAVYSSEASLDFYRPTRRYIPADSPLQLLCYLQEVNFFYFLWSLLYPELIPVTVFGIAYLFNRFTCICAYHICYGLFNDAASRSDCSPVNERII
jgi:hypothetical protein